MRGIRGRAYQDGYNGYDGYIRYDGHVREGPDSTVAYPVESDVPPYPSYPSYLFYGLMICAKPVMLTSRNIGVRGGRSAGVRNSVSKL